MSRPFRNVTALGEGGQDETLNLDTDLTFLNATSAELAAANMRASMLRLWRTRPSVIQHVAHFAPPRLAFDSVFYCVQQWWALPWRAVTRLRLRSRPINKNRGRMFDSTTAIRVH